MRLLYATEFAPTAALLQWHTVGYVPQEIFLTDASVAENIALGIAPAKIDKDRVSLAARMANIDAFIRTELPYGYDTTLGERGVMRSGELCQWLVITSAHYHDA